MIPEMTAPLALGLFFLASGIMIWRFESLENSGFQGTVLGTLIMPYCSGLANLIFAFLMARSGGDGALVLENCLVNNVTNLTLLLGLPAVIWSLDVFPKNRVKPGPARQVDMFRINRLSVLLSLVACLFFTGILWVLTRDGTLDFYDGLVLTGVFFFWQGFHVYDVLKDNVRHKRSFSWFLPLDLAVIIGCGYVTYISIEHLVASIPRQGEGFLSYTTMGWLSGILMVLPNALLAFYYAGRQRAEIVVSSQVGDGHICIPLSIGLFALFNPIRVPAFFDTGIYIILAAAGFHFFFVAFFRQIPRTMGLVLTGTYFYFLYRGFFSLLS